jgi:hypothetical protein
MLAGAVRGAAALGFRFHFFGVAWRCHPTQRRGDNDVCRCKASERFCSQVHHDLRRYTCG